MGIIMKYLFSISIASILIAILSILWNILQLVLIMFLSYWIVIPIIYIGFIMQSLYICVILLSVLEKEYKNEIG